MNLGSISNMDLPLQTKLESSPMGTLLDNPQHECLVRVAGIGPMKGFLNFDLHLVLDFITSRGDQKQSDVIKRLAGLIQELKAAFKFLCREDKNCIKQSCVTLRNKEALPEMIGTNTSLALNWALIEVAKHCVKAKFSPDLSISEFLHLLRFASQPAKGINEKIPKRCLINFLFNLEKYLQDRVSISSSRLYTFTHSTEIEDFYTLNSSMFRSWLAKERQDVTISSLIVDDPAECWRIISDRLYQDLYTKNQIEQDSNQQQSSSSLGVDAKRLQSQLSLLVLAARQLESSALLRGLKTLINLGEIVSDHKPIVTILSNLENHYERTYAMLEPDKEHLKDQHVIEYLNSCIELGLPIDCQDSILDRVHGDVYRTFFQSTSSGSPIAVDALKNWLKTWAPVTSEQTSMHSLQDNLNLMIPSCLNFAVRCPKDESSSYIDIGQNLMKQDLLSHLLFPPSPQNSLYEVFGLTIELIKDCDTHLDDLVNRKTSDITWCKNLYKTLHKMNLLDKIHRKHQKSIEMIELQAAKFHKRFGNIDLCKTIIERLQQRTGSIEMKVKSTLVAIDFTEDSNRKSNLLQMANEVKSSNYPFELKQNLNAKILHNLLITENCDRSDELKLMSIIKGTSQDIAGDEKQVTGNPFDSWREVLDSTEYPQQARILLTLSARARNHLQTIERDENYKIALNSTFELELELLYVLAHCNKKFHIEALECASRLLQMITSDHHQLDPILVESIKDDSFINGTLPVWSCFKTNLTSIAEYKSDLAGVWQDFFIYLVKRAIADEPVSFLYPVIVNRLDLDAEKVDLENANHILKAGNELGKGKSSATNLKCQKDELDRRTDECKHKLAFWLDLERAVSNSRKHDEKWPEVLCKTEEFIREIRRISFLKGEYLKNLTVRIPKRLFSFLDYFGRAWESSMGTIMSKQKMEECEKKLATTCEEALYHVNNLLSHCGSGQSAETNTTKYDAWFKETFQKQLKELEYRLNLLVAKRPLVFEELDKLIKSIVELMTLIRQSLIRYNHNNRQKLYMELISPKLSRFEPSSIPMPEHYAQSALSSKTTSEITIYKVYQTVDLISSKTSPKKMTFIGSDGISRSYLLKAHDDLRLDQLTMSIFSIVNDLFKEIAREGDHYRIRRYAITPVSSRSGLIQWIDAPSLASKYRDWLNSDKGRHLTDEVFASTCEYVCEDLKLAKSNPVDHSNCQLPATVSLGDLFYQLLWARTKPSRNPITQSRPFFGSSAKYRAEFAPTIFQSVVELLSDKVPNDLLAKSLWYGSNNSYSYWLKTQSFTRSCAAISIIGYILGLGDRHPENILLDMGTGEVIHIDYSICFELGKTLVIPEQVPFRLTPTIIRAFGFAGLEGEFTLSCIKVLTLLRKHKSLLLYLLDPLNLSFMIGRDSKASIDIKGATRATFYRSGSNLQPMKSPIGTSYNKTANEMEMCSQESDKMVSISEDINNLLMLSNSPPAKAYPTVELQPAKPSVEVPTLYSDIQHNIKTPTKIMIKTAENIHKRITEKLSGTDEGVRRNDYRKQDKLREIMNLVDGVGGDSAASTGSNDRAVTDLILLNTAQTVEEQVDGLIAEATSIKNKAAMFEGWMPWL